MRGRAGNESEPAGGTLMKILTLVASPCASRRKGTPKCVVARTWLRECFKKLLDTTGPASRIQPPLFCIQSYYLNTSGATTFAFGA